MSPTASSFSMLCSSLMILLTSSLLKFFKLDFNTQNLSEVNHLVEISVRQDNFNTFEMSKDKKDDGNLKYYPLPE
jgi:hypothetical protein